MGITSVDVKKIYIGRDCITFSENNLTTDQVKSKSYWLADRLLGATEESSRAITDNSYENGYHTQSVGLYLVIGETIDTAIWYVHPFSLRHSDGTYLGIRPVIEISKDKL